MYLRICIALLLLLPACATTESSERAAVDRSPRIANLQRAAVLPWKDEGRCIVQEASQPWRMAVERCFHALDTQRVRFSDIQRRCQVASVDAASVETMVGICLLAQPELVVGAVAVIGAVAVAVAIKEELDLYQLRGRYPEDDKAVAQPATEPAPQHFLAKRTPKPQESPSGKDWPPPVTPESTDRKRRPECEPHKVPHRGGNALHNMCADKIPNNDFSGWDALVNGKNFDGLQLLTFTLWEVKTDEFDEHSPRSQEFFVRMKLPELQDEKRRAMECGYHFVIGVRSPVQKAMLLDLDSSLQIVVMDWC